MNRPTPRTPRAIAAAPARPVIMDVLLPQSSAGVAALRAALLIAVAVAAMAIAAKVRVPMWPVPVTMQIFVVMAVGAAYGPRLGLASMLAYLVVGAAGFDVFTSSAAGDPTKLGLTYMLGTTGGYLVGFVLAAGMVGWLARCGWDRSPLWMAASMLVGLALVYIPGVLWLGHVVGWDKPVLDWGLWPFLWADMAKLALATAIFPLAWRLARPHGQG